MSISKVFALSVVRIMALRKWIRPRMYDVSQVSIDTYKTGGIRFDLQRDTRKGQPFQRTALLFRDEVEVPLSALGWLALAAGGGSTELVV